MAQAIDFNGNVASYTIGPVSGDITSIDVKVDFHFEGGFKASATEEFVLGTVDVHYGETLNTFYDAITVGPLDDTLIVDSTDGFKVYGDALQTFTIATDDPDLLADLADGYTFDAGSPARRAGRCYRRCRPRRRSCRNRAARSGCCAADGCSSVQPLSVLEHAAGYLSQCGWLTAVRSG